MSNKKAIRRMVARERAQAQAALPSLFERAPHRVNRSASRMEPTIRKETRAHAQRRSLRDY